METDRYLALLRSDGTLLADSARPDLEAAVPPCPGWAVRDVVTHTAEVYEHKLACIALQAPPEPWPPDWPADRDPLAWFDDAHGRLLDVLGSTDPATPAYTWWPPDQTMGFWVRRMAQETAVHRVDVQSAFNAVTPVDDELAVDGVDEVLMLMLAGDWSDEPTDDFGAGKRVAVSTGGRSWLVELRSEAVVVVPATAEPPAGDGSVSGAPSEVLLWLWGRRPDDAVTFAGDLALQKGFRARLAQATE